MLKFLAYDWVCILGVFGRFCVPAVMVYLGVSLLFFLLFLFFRLLAGFALNSARLNKREEVFCL
jgi:hypothetical protein